MTTHLIETLNSTVQPRRLHVAQLCKLVLLSAMPSFMLLSNLGGGGPTAAWRTICGSYRWSMGDYFLYCAEFGGTSYGMDHLQHDMGSYDVNSLNISFNSDIIVALDNDHNIFLIFVLSSSDILGFLTSEFHEMFENKYTQKNMFPFLYTFLACLLYVPTKFLCHYASMCGIT